MLTGWGSGSTWMTQRQSSSWSGLGLLSFAFFRPSSCFTSTPHAAAPANGDGSELQPTANGDGSELQPTANGQRWGFRTNGGSAPSVQPGGGKGT